MQQILFLSFLKQLRARDIKAWRLVLFCISLQLIFIVIKLEATPFFLFGMFSEKMKLTDTIIRHDILVNGKPISDYRPSLRQSQLLETTLINYIDMKRNGDTDPVKTRIESRYPFIYNSGIYDKIASGLYNNSSGMQQYRNWLKLKCLRVAGIRPATLNSSTADSVRISIIKTKYLPQNQGAGLIKFKYETLETF